MTFVVKDWKDYPNATTPLNAAALEDLETRLAAYADSVGGGGGGGGAWPSINIKSSPYNAVGTDTGNQATVIQNALNDAAAAGGGDVVVPAGTFRCTAGITIPSKVNLIGQGPGTSVLKFTELGTGNVAVTTNGFQNTASQIRSLMIQGPGSFSIGVQNANCDGVYMAQSVGVYDSFIYGFRGGLVMNEDHNLLLRTKVGNCYYNVLYPDANLSKGNQIFYQCDLEGANFACVAAFGTNNLDFVSFIGGQCGQAPYGFFKADGASASVVGLMTHCVLNNFTFEGIGNAAIWDESTGSANGADTLNSVEIINPGFVWGGPTREIGARSQDYAVKVRMMNNCTIRGAYPFSPGDIATYHVPSGTGNVIELPTATVQSAKQFSTAGFDGDVSEPGTWGGRVAIASGTISRGDILEYNATFGEVRRYQGVYEFAGIAMESVTNGQSVIFANEGRPLVQIDVSGNPGWAVKPSATTQHHGVAAPNYQFASAAAPTKDAVIGTILVNGTGLVNVKLHQRYDRFFIQPATVSALPTASSTYRGQFLRVEGGTGVADALYICEKNASNAYVWRQI